MKNRSNHLKARGHKWRLVPVLLFVLQSCTVQRGLVQQDSLQNRIENDSILGNAFVGVSIYDVEQDQYLFDHNSDKIFVPASNTKLLTTYASLKYLPDSIPGWYWQETADSLFLYPNGDPTFFHRDFQQQPLIALMNRVNKPVMIALDERPGFSRFGAGWPWDYFQSTSVPERSQMPLYGNFARLRVDAQGARMVPGYFTQFLSAEVPTVNADAQNYVLTRAENDNQWRAAASSRSTMARPFTQHSDPMLAFKLLQDTLSKTHPHLRLHLAPNKRRPAANTAGLNVLYTAEKDTVLGVMMKRSDNFIAEQLLIMAGSEITGRLTDRGAINHILRTDLANLPDQKNWADGSGLSRNNQFSPRFYIGLLRQMKDEFGYERVREILPHGNQGTLSGYYRGQEDRIFAKTGTLNGTIALSGYLIADSGKKLVFSVLVNHHQRSAVDVRRSVEEFLRTVMKNY